MSTPRLSICMATRNRARFIGQTLESLLAQLQAGVEVVVVDGASSDDTPQVMAGLQALHPGIRYYRQAANSGVDRDYDKAVDYASGDYCWLMTDDDLLRPGAVARVLACTEREVDLIVVNAEARSADLSRTLKPRLLELDRDREYRRGESERLFADAASYLSFIGGVVVRRKFWLGRERAPYYGSLFIHVGVIFQMPPVERALIIAEPLITLRFGVAGWAPRSFEIWFTKWPQLVWSFSHFAESTRSKVYPREPWTQPRRLFFYRAIGAYGRAEYRRFLADRPDGWSKLAGLAVASIPGRLANFIASLYFATLKRSPLELYDLSRSREATWLTRLLSRLR